MRYLSVCSGIEAATAAWHPLGWEPWAFSEIEKFPAAVLAHHYPDVPNLGDMTKYKEWPDAALDVLVGGTPCQSFSIAGLRRGLDDPRGNLMLTYLAIAGRYRPKWMVWENVPGVLSSNGGRDFGTFLAGLGELGYGFAYRVLDAQYVRVDSHPRAVPQRRRRVFVVGCLGDWRRAAAVLFERESLSGNTAPRREAGERVAAYTPGSIGGYRSGVGTLRANGGDMQGGSETILVQPVASPLTARMHKGVNTTMDEGQTMVAFHPTQDPIHSDNVCHALGTGSGGGTATAAVAFAAKDYGADAMEGVSPTLRAGGHNTSHQNGGVMPAVAIQERAVSENPDAGPDGKGYRDDGAAYTLESRQTPQAVAFSIMPMNSGKDYKARETPVAQPLMAAGPTSGNQGGDYIAERYAVRRLTPRECERLQGFPDDFTAIPWRGKPADQCPDGPRYKALGNSMAVNVMRWIGERIQTVDGIGGAE